MPSRARPGDERCTVAQALGFGTAHAKSSCSPSVGGSLVIDDSWAATGVFTGLTVGAAGASPSCNATVATVAGTVAAVVAVVVADADMDAGAAVGAAVGVAVGATGLSRGGLPGPAGRLASTGLMTCIGFQVDLAFSAFAAPAMRLSFKGAAGAAAAGGRATAIGGGVGRARGGAQFSGADCDGACGGGGGRGGGGEGGEGGGGRWPWNCHGVSCHCEERECSACASDLNLLRCRRFWNQTCTLRADMPRCTDSLSRCSTSGWGSLSKAATSTLICFWARLMRLVILASGAWSRKECGRAGLCAASCRADWRPWNQALTVSGVVPLWAASSAHRAVSSCGLARKAVASACSAAVLHVVLMLCGGSADKKTPE